jgi:hypothetical protein
MRELLPKRFLSFLHTAVTGSIVEQHVVEGVSNLHLGEGDPAKSGYLITG